MALMGDYTHLLWTDLETTGTDERLDGILEIATILTDLDLNVIDQDQRVVIPTVRQMERLRDNDYVYQMHQNSGLLDECLGGEGETISDVDILIMGWLRSYKVESHKVLIAGSGVAHFDRRFVHVHMPHLDKYLAYPALDVGVMRRAWDMWGGSTRDYPEQERKTHRAADDIALHLDEGRWFANQICGDRT